MCGPLAFISWFFISYIVDLFQDRALSEEVRGRVLESSTSASQSAFILWFPRVMGMYALREISLRNYDST